MCKILTFTDASKINMKKHVNDLANTLLAMTKDGVGYAAIGSKGVFGEKSIARKFKSRHYSKNHVMLPIVKNVNLRFGEASEILTGPAILHGRTSTNTISLLNTHPMQMDNWNLIHNGVVNDHGPKYDKLTKNDSEDLLKRLIEGIDSVQKYLEGYYAFAAIDPDGRLHVGRDNLATLFIAWSAELNTFIIATTEDLIYKVNKILGAKCGPVEEIQDNVYMIFKGNALLHKETIKPLGFTEKQSKHAEKSLGRLIFDGRSNASDLSPEEKSYYAYLEELENIDDSYEIYLPDGKPISAMQFTKMEHKYKEYCTIIRHDGTLVLPFEGQVTA